MGDKKRKRWPFDDDDLFGYFDDMLDDMRKRMERVFSGALKDLESGKPYVWGYTFRMGPDGKPEFHQFGDTGALKPWVSESKREPLTDVMEREESISITVELPGVEKNEIALRSTASKVTIEVKNPQRPYYKEVDLPSAVDPDSVEATFKNGVLDITLKKTEGKAGREVKID